MATKTEHSGPKRGRGAFHGHRKEAKDDSRKKRRLNDKVATRLLRRGRHSGL